MYIINLAGFKRLTVAGGILMLVIAKLIELTSGTDSPFHTLAPGFFFGFMTAFTVCWISITANAKKADEPSPADGTSTRDAE